jgi:HK97 family phage major capsid protein
MATPTKGMKTEAAKGLKWREEYGRGGTRIGAIRARQIVAGENLSDSTIKRMYSYFARHEVDKEAEGFNVGEDGYPSNGRIAWALWGGDAGFSWSKNLVEKMDEERHIQNVVETEDSYIIEFGKAMPETAEETEELVEDIAIENAYDDEDEENKRFLEAKQFSTRELNQDFIDEEKRTVRIALTSETPVMRSFGYEILSHDAEDIDMSFMASGRSPLLLDHDPEKQIGVIESYSLDSNTRRTLAQVRFGRSDLATEVFNDVLDGIRQNVSVGYQVTKMRKDENEKNTYRVSFFPMEASIVSIPADQSAGVGVARSNNNNSSKNSEVTKMEENKTETKVEPTVNVEEVRSIASSEAKSNYSKEVDEILELGARHNKSDLSREAIRKGVSVSDFRGQLLNEIGSEPLDTKEIGLTNKETKRFSVLKAINAMANPTDRKAQEEAAFEFECSRAAGEIYGRTAQGVLLPPEVLSNWSQRDLNSSDDAGLIGQDFRGGDFIDALRNSSAVMQNATILSGLSGDVKIPKKTAASSAAFISSEGGAAGESEMTIGSVTMTPRTLGAFTDVTRQLMIQSSLDVENLIRNDLAGSMAIALDNAALEGSGSSGNPTGITNTTGINTVSLSSAAAPTFGEMVSMETSVAVDNALLGGLVYIVHPSNAGTLKTTEKATNTAQFVYTDGLINGYPVVVSAQLTANNYVFGNMQDLLVGLFSGVDLVVDPYTNSSSGTVRVVALQSCDVNVRNAVSFCAAS